MPKSKEEIAKEVLLEVGEYATTQTPSGADIKICTDKYDQVYALLLSKKLVSWGPDDSVPEEAVLPIVAIVSRTVTTIFGVGGQTLQDIVAKAGISEAVLRDIMTTDYSAEDTQMEYM